MIEHPNQFNALTVDFLEEQFGPAELTTSPT
jgi:hypothetical protein